MEHREDVIVIGGGVIGVCAAYYLLKEGRKVTILERDKVCSGSSYGNSGLIVSSECIPIPRPGVVMRALRWMLDPESPFYIKPRLDPKLISWLWQFRAASARERVLRATPVLLELCQASLALYDELVAQEVLECGYAHSGLLVLYRSHREYEEGLEEADFLQECGLQMRRMTGSEIHDMDPAVRPDLAGGVHYPEDAKLNPSEFVFGLASRVREMGATIQEGTEVVEIDTSSTKTITVSTTTLDYQADHVVLAAGSWSPGLVRDLRPNLPIQPAKGYSVNFKRPTNLPKQPMILSEAKVSINPMGSMMRIAGTLELSGLDLTINPRRVNAIARAADDYLIREEGDLPPEDAWSGLRPVTPDGIPVIGHAESRSNLIVASGHAMLGMTLGPVTGKLVAELASEQTPTVDLAPLSLARFH